MDADFLRRAEVVLALVAEAGPWTSLLWTAVEGRRAAWRRRGVHCTIAASSRAIKCTCTRMCMCMQAVNKKSYKNKRTKVNYKHVPKLKLQTCTCPTMDSMCMCMYMCMLVHALVHVHAHAGYSNRGVQIYLEPLKAR